MAEKDVKNIKIVDYFSQSRKLVQNNGFTVDETQSSTSNKIPSHSEYPHSSGLIFNEGNELKHSLIDVTRAYDYMNKMKEIGNNPNRQGLLNSDLIANNAYKRDVHGENGDSIDLVPSNQLVKRSNPTKKWSKILQYMEKNPQVLMEAIPSPRDNDTRPQLKLGQNFKSITNKFKQMEKEITQPMGGINGYNRFGKDSETDKS